MSTPPLVSVVVPAWHRDEPLLEERLDRLVPDDRVEVLVVLPPERRRDLDEWRAMRPGVRFVEAPLGRGAQMNAGAAQARGRWLLFLHVDTRLPAGWTSVVEHAEGTGDVVGGAFRWALDSGAWQARVMEWGVRLRVAVFGLPYGDQALFVRRDVFQELGGYRDMPLMEDVELVRRLARRGRLFWASLAATTSARRWQRQGWFTRTAANLSLLLRYRLGASPAALARRYSGRHAVTVAMMARAPGAPGKSRLAPEADPRRHEQLRAALFDDTLDVLRRVPGIDRVVMCEPPALCDQIQAHVGPAVDVVPQRRGDLGARMRGAIEHALRGGAEGVVLIGSDLPDLPPRIVGEAVAALATSTRRVVLGPAADGGYYLIGVTAPHGELFDGLGWGTGTVFAETASRTAALGLELVTLPPWADVDDEAGLDRLASTKEGAPRTRAWIASHRNACVVQETT